MLLIPNRKRREQHDSLYQKIVRLAGELRGWARGVLFAQLPVACQCLRPPAAPAPGRPRYAGRLGSACTAAVSGGQKRAARLFCTKQCCITAGAGGLLLCSHAGCARRAGHRLCGCLCFGAARKLCGFKSGGGVSAGKWLTAAKRFVRRRTGFGMPAKHRALCLNSARCAAFLFYETEEFL